MKKAATATNAQFRVRMVYGFKHNHEVVVLGTTLSGKVEKGMISHATLEHGTNIGEWKIKEVLNIDFINDQDHTDFIGLVLQCETTESYNLLQSLRVYGETLVIERK